MTREEAIIMLKGIKAEYLDLDNVYIKDRHEALSVAIEMLEKKVSEPWCEGCPFCYIARVCDKTSQRGCRWNELKEMIE